MDFIISLFSTVLTFLGTEQHSILDLIGMCIILYQSAFSLFGFGTYLYFSLHDNQWGLFNGPTDPSFGTFFNRFTGMITVWPWIIHNDPQSWQWLLDLFQTLAVTIVVFPQWIANTLLMTLATLFQPKTIDEHSPFIYALFFAIPVLLSGIQVLQGSINGAEALYNSIEDIYPEMGLDSVSIVIGILLNILNMLPTFLITVQYFPTYYFVY